MNEVLDSAKFIAEKATHVHVSKEGCSKAAEAIFKAMQEKHYSTDSWKQHKLNPDPAKMDPVKVIDWIFTVDLLNFSFWSDYDHEDSGKASSQRYAVEYQGELYTGYWSLVAAVNRALDAGIPITTPSEWSEGKLDYEKIFESATKEQIPMLTERIIVLKEAGDVMAQLGYSHFAEMVAKADKSAMALLQSVTQWFRSFNDVCQYEGKTVKFHKRAQILISDIWACFGGEEYGEFNDIDQITMFADYRVPQILTTLKCIKMTEGLQNDLIQLVPLEHGDSREVELRGCSIWAVELVKQHILKKHPDSGINSILLDFYLWDTAKHLQQEHGGNFDVPCHRTRSIFY